MSEHWSEGKGKPGHWNGWSLEGLKLCQNVIELLRMGTRKCAEEG